MKERMTHPAVLVPGALDVLYALGTATRDLGVPSGTIGLVQLRASQINGCAVTIETHSRVLEAGGEDPTRIAALATWPGNDLFTDAERSALALAEAVTRIADRTDPVPDAVWDEAAKHYDEKCLAGLLLAIASINLWNRLNVATHQVNPL